MDGKVKRAELKARFGKERGLAPPVRRAFFSSDCQKYQRGKNIAGIRLPL